MDEKNVNYLCPEIGRLTVKCCFNKKLKPNENKLGQCVEKNIHWPKIRYSKKKKKIIRKREYWLNYLASYVRLGIFEQLSFSFILFSNFDNSYFQSIAFRSIELVARKLVVLLICSENLSGFPTFCFSPPLLKRLLMLCLFPNYDVNDSVHYSQTFTVLIPTVEASLIWDAFSLNRISVTLDNISILSLTATF